MKFKILCLALMLGGFLSAHAQVAPPTAVHFATEVDSMLEQQDVVLVVELSGTPVQKLHVEVGCNEAGATDIANVYLDFDILDPGSFSSFRQEGNTYYLGLGIQQLVPIYATVYTEDANGNQSATLSATTN